MSISGISQLLLTQFWWNFKGSFLGTSRTDSNYQVDICPGNICPGDICPYQEYLSCYWPDVDQTLKVGSRNHLQQMPTVMVLFIYSTFVLVTLVPFRNISAVTNSDLIKLLRKITKKYFDVLFLEPDHFTQNFCTHNLLDSKLDLSFFKPKYLEQNFLGPTFYFTQIFSDPTPILTWIAFWSKSFLA